MYTTMETYSGRLVDLAKPDPRDISIEDIAWHLSRQPRFAGATLSENVYSVAQHSVLVMNRVRQKIQPNIEKMDPITVTAMLASALLHDAHEAYMGDVTAPMSNLLDLSAPIKRLKDRLQHAIYRSLQRDLVRDKGKKFAPYVGDIIQDADDWALTYEGYHLMHSKGKSWNSLVGILEEQERYRNFIVWAPAHASDNFLSHYHQIVNSIGE